MSYSEIREVEIHEANRLLGQGWILVGMLTKVTPQYPGNAIVYVMGKGIELVPEYANVPAVPEYQWQGEMLQPYQVEARVNEVLVEAAKLRMIYLDPERWRTTAVEEQVEQIVRAFDRLPEGLVTST